MADPVRHWLLLLLPLCSVPCSAAGAAQRSCTPCTHACRYEFLTPNGLHVAMSVAAKSGRVYVCGASAVKDKWATYGPGLVASANSFTIKGKDGA